MEGQNPGKLRGEMNWGGSRVRQKINTFKRKEKERGH